MKEKHTLRNYLIKYFLIIMMLAGAAETLLNMIFSSVMGRWLKGVPGMSTFFDEIGLRDAVSLSITTFLRMILGYIGRLIPRVGFFKNISQELDNRVWSQLTEAMGHMSRQESEVYFAGIISLCVLMFLIWILPYLAGAAVFGVIVSKKSAAIDKEKEELQLKYEKRRNLLLSDVAHDLKTPITTVAGYSKALAEGSVPDEEKQKEYLDAIYRKSMKMNELIVLLFEYVKLDSEGFELKLETADLCEILRENTAAMYSDFEENNIEVEIDIPDEKIEYKVDRVQFSRVINNLLINIIRHNPKGVKAGVSIKRLNGRINIEISDTGEKIPEEISEHLFEPFVQSDTSRSSKGGSGLGLSIAKKVISMHGGQLSLVQEKTKTFLISFKEKNEEY